jgi:hypothetical protein
LALVVQQLQMVLTVFLDLSLRSVVVVVERLQAMVLLVVLVVVRLVVVMEVHALVQARQVL